MKVDEKIAGVRIRCVVVPLQRPINTASGALERAPLVLIDVETESGIVGSAYTMAFDVRLLKAMGGLTQALADMAIGLPVSPYDVEKFLRKRMTLFGGSRGLAGVVISGVDMALWDALAKIVGQPLVRILGGRPTPIRAYNSLGLMKADEVPKLMDSVLDGGFLGIKIKLGWPTFAEDLASVRAVKRAIPDNIAVMADYNQSLTVQEAIRRARGLDDEGLTWIEEPVRCDDFLGCADVAAQARTPIQLGENFAGVDDMTMALRANSCDFVMPDAQQIGGVSGWMRAATLAAANSRPMSAHVFLELSAHVLPVTPSADWLEYYNIAGAILAEQPAVDDGMVVASEKPGAGIEWNERAIKDYALS